MLRYWLSYDLGIRGNYEELYEWLDEMGAEECGDSVVTFLTSLQVEDIKDSLNKVLNEGARIYLIGRLSEKKITGKFIIGRRKKNAPWYGYAKVEADIEDSFE